ncbi:MAG: glycerate kinase [Actinomycetota bacterium]
MRVLVAPDKFKGTLTAGQAAAAIATGWRRARPGDEVDQLPIADGGEGTLDAIVTALGGERHSLTVTGPLGDPVGAEFGLVARAGRRSAIVEMAQASGLELVGPERRDPLRASTFGTGELIAAACREGAEEVVVCIGGSATNDGGAGMAQAVGIRLLDARGRDIGRGGAALLDLATIDLRGLDRAAAAARFVVAVDVDNRLTGPLGASAVYGPQKGASAEDVVLLDRALGHLAAVVARDLGIDVRDVPGAGAAGGLGAGLVAFLGASLRPGADVVMEAVGFDARLAGAHVVVTGEGRFDEQSLHGKAVGAVLDRAERARVPAIVLCGEADVRPRGVLVRSLAEAVGTTTAMEQPRRALEDGAAGVAAQAEQLSSGA